MQLSGVREVGPTVRRSGKHGSMPTGLLTTNFLNLEVWGPHRTLASAVPYTSCLHYLSIYLESNIQIYVYYIEHIPGRARIISAEDIWGLWLWLQNLVLPLPRLHLESRLERVLLVKPNSQHQVSTYLHKHTHTCIRGEDRRHRSVKRGADQWEHVLVQRIMTLSPQQLLARYLCSSYD